MQTSLVRLPSSLKREKNIAERVRRIANCIVETLDSPVDEICYELMEVYSRRGQRGPAKRVDPNQLLKVVLLAGQVAGRLDVKATCYQPKEWLSGGSAKDYDHPFDSARGKRAKRAFSREEFTLIEDGNHDQVDAACIGLHHLGRFAPIDCRVFPGAV